MDVIDRKNCPVCGTPVRVVSSGEGTNYYQPINEAQNEELIKIKIMEAARRWTKRKGHGPDHDCDLCNALRAYKEE